MPKKVGNASTKPARWNNDTIVNLFSPYYNKMEYQYIVNPETNRRVSIQGRLGRQVLRNYLAQWHDGGGHELDQKLTFHQLGTSCCFEGTIAPPLDERKVKVDVTKVHGECSVKTGQKGVEAEMVPAEKGGGYKVGDNDYNVQQGTECPNQ